MKDSEKSKEQLVEELNNLRGQVEQLRQIEAEYKQTERDLQAAG